MSYNAKKTDIILGSSDAVVELLLTIYEIPFTICGFLKSLLHLADHLLPLTT